MKRLTLITTTTLMLVLLTVSAVNAQRGMRPSMRGDSLARPSRITERPDNRRFYMERVAPPHSYMIPGRGNMWNNPGYRGQAPHFRAPQRMDHRGFRSDSSFRAQMPHLGLRGVTPALDDAQIKKLDELRAKHKEEIDKLRNEFDEKITAMRDSHKAKTDEILSDEQKKSLDDRSLPQPGFRGRPRW